MFNRKRQTDRRSKENFRRKKFKLKAKMSSLAFFLLLLQQLSSSLSVANTAEASAPQVSLPAGQLLRLAGESVQFECPLSPLSAPTGEGVALARRRALVIDGARPRPARNRRQEGDQSQLPAEFKELQEMGEESVEMILWYHSQSEASQHQQPIYSVDARKWARKEAQWNSGGHSPLLPVAPPLPANLHAEGPKGQEGQFNYVENKDGGATFVASLHATQARHYAFAPLSSRIRVRIGPENHIASNNSNPLSPFPAARRKSPGGEDHSSSPTTTTNPKAYLIIDNLEASDAGQYKCRVDFKNARTRYQTSGLQVITPITGVQLRAHSPAIDLRPTTSLIELEHEPGSRRASNNLAKVSEEAPNYIEANEDDPLLLECRPKDGWPRAKLAWWSLNWAPRGPSASSEPTWRLFPVLTQLSAWNSSEAKINSSVESILKGQTQITFEELPLAWSNNRKLPHLINANTNLPVGRTNTLDNGSHVADVGELARAEGGSHAGVGNSDWYHSIQRILLEALSGLDGVDPGEQGNNYSAITGNPNPNTNHSDLSLDGQAQIVSSFLARRLSFQSINARKKVDHISQTQLESDLFEKPSMELWRILKQNQLVLYICGATNTASLWESSQQKQKRQQPDKNELGDSPEAGRLSVEPNSEQHDKLAKIRPVFGSLLLRANTRPKEIQMFLVKRVSRETFPPSVGKNKLNISKENVIELSPLKEGQSLHLNLESSKAISITTGERQLQFVCFASGSRPKAKLVWSKMSELGGGGGGELLLDPELELETEKLINSRKSLAGRGLKEEEPSQWSSLRLTNITFLDHQTSLKCSARNEKFPSPEHTLSLSLKLNITQQPLLRLQQLGGGEKEETGSDRDTVTVVPANKRLSFLCQLLFANPPTELLQPAGSRFEWLLDEIPLSKTSGWQILNQEMSLVVSASEEEAGAERLTMEFSLSDKKDLAIRGELRCRAKNAIGIGQSEALELLIGKEPHCNEGQEVEWFRDYSQPEVVHCHVRSDKHSSSFRWNIKSKNQSEIVTTAEPTITLARLLEAAGHSDGSIIMNSTTCYAVDKFGRNDKSPCQIRAGLKSSSVLLTNKSQDRQVDHVESLCGASLSRLPAEHKSIKRSDGRGVQKLLLNVECRFDEHDEFQKRSHDHHNRIIELDLYRKRDFKFLRRLTSGGEDSDDGEDSPNELLFGGRNHRNTRTPLSLTFELGGDLALSRSSRLEDLEAEHLLVMSLRDKRTGQQLRQVNITLGQHEGSDKTSGSGLGERWSLKESKRNQSVEGGASTDQREQRMRLVTSLSFLFGSSLFLVLVSYLCRAKTASRGLGAKPAKDPSSSWVPDWNRAPGDEGHQSVNKSHWVEGPSRQVDLQETELSLIQDQLEVANKQPILVANDSAELFILAGSEHSQAYERVVTSASSFETTATAASSTTFDQRQGYLLIDSTASHTCGRQPTGPARRLPGEHLANCHIQLEPEQARGAISGQQPLCQLLGNQEALSSSSFGNSSNESSRNCKRQHVTFSLTSNNVQLHPTLFIPQTTLNKCNSKPQMDILNSHGELTLTDESTSFINEINEFHTSNPSISYCRCQTELTKDEVF